MMFAPTMAIETLIAELRNADPNSRTQAAMNLGQSNHDHAFQPLLDALQDPDARVRLVVITALRHYGDMRAIEPLIPLLRDTDRMVRMTAAMTLGEWRDRRAVVPLRTLLDDPDSSVRSVASRSLGQIGGPAIPVLFELLLDPTYETLGRQGMLSLNPINSASMLLRGLVDPNPRVRAYAAEFLGQFADEDVAHHLEMALEDTDEDVCLYAKLSLHTVQKQLTETALALDPTPSFEN